MKRRILWVLTSLTLSSLVFGGTPAVKVGADVLVEDRLQLLSGKRVGLITNLTGRVRTGKFLLDILRSKGICVTAIFAPEHGIRGTDQAGETYRDSVDSRTGVRIYSLYGTTKKPTPDMLQAVDVLVYDIQDVGVRCYTYISTMALCMEAAAAVHIPFIVLDRPNPLGGEVMDGPVLPDSLRSFVGYLPIPTVYGLTAGELAEMANEEGWLKGGARVDLTVIPMSGWTRTMSWSETGLTWIAPSPNIPTIESAIAYPMTVYLEATNISEGRGTPAPFRMLGAPFLPADSLSVRLQPVTGEGIQFRDTSFTPTFSKHRGTSCAGVFLTIALGPLHAPVRKGMLLLSRLRRLAGRAMLIDKKSLALLVGDNEAVDIILRGSDVTSVFEGWTRSAKAFQMQAARYRLYPEKQ